LIVDEAHATGVEGAEGRGLVHELRRSDRVLASIHTCGKALASMGAFVAGSQVLHEFLINHARPFIFSTALPPYCAAHVQASLTLVAEADRERAQLRELGDYLRSQMRASGFDPGGSSSQIVPLILGENDVALRFAAALSAAGFAVRAIRPPSVPVGSARLRFSLNAGLRTSDIDLLLNALCAARDGKVLAK
jgi:8-amino-7-oxononanoate synthase